MKNKSWKFWALIVVAVFVIIGAGQQLGLINDPNKETGKENSQTTAEPTETKETPASSEKTTGGIDYGHAVQACDNTAKDQLFPGAKYNSDPIMGEQKSGVGIDDSQFLAVYNVKVDGHKTAITCLVDGTVDAINVVSIKETEWK
ncbi:hypothetical protein [Arcanobacterium buesumense]|uniref:Uncharacterized protein n=1 Tax=Arcanobacterium buesumense TaxID=2722751 RepID=A0A6H2ELT0_9ACTO|nr:hypothetical protein [Arcanobacterium buesumense]QJC22038.1 hypothetical protein HC352_05655 [Arcanobacterium buesumense]